MNCETSIPSHQHSQPRPQAPSVGLSQSSSTKRMSCRREIDADRLQRAEIEVLQVRRRGFQDRLVLVIMLQPVGVLAIAPILGTPAGLDIGRAPRLADQATASVVAGWNVPAPISMS